MKKSNRDERMINHLFCKHKKYYAEYMQHCVDDTVDPVSLSQVQDVDENAVPVAVTFRVDKTASNSSSDCATPIKRRSSSSSSSSAAKRVSTTDTSLNDSMTSAMNTITESEFDAQHRRNVAVCYAENSIAHNVAQSDSFKTMLQFVRTHAHVLPVERPVSIVNRQIIRDEQSAIAKELRGDIIRKLRHLPVTVAIDGWTDINQTKVTNVVLLSEGNAYYWTGIFNKANANSGQFIADKMIPILKQLQKHGLHIVALATDNESAMTVAHSLIAKHRVGDTYPFRELIHVRCGAHTINLIVGELLKHPVASSIIHEMIASIQAITYSKELRHKFIAIQAGNDEAPKSLELPCDTRWNSYYVSLERFILLRSAVMAILASASRSKKPSRQDKAIGRHTIHTDDWWKKATELRDLLEPFTQAINFVQSDKATLQTANIAFDYLHDYLAKTFNGAGSLVGPANAAMEKFTNAWWKPLHECRARQFLKLLVQHMSDGVTGRTEVRWRTTGDDTITTTAVIEWFCRWGADYLINIKAPLLTDHVGKDMSIRDSLILTLQNDYWHFHAGDASMADVYRCYQRNITTNCGRRNRWDAQYAVKHADTAQEAAAYTAISQAPVAFAWACRALLKIAPSEAAVERTFSAQGILMTKRRNRFADVGVTNELAIKFNRTAMRDEGKARTFASLASVTSASDDEETEEEEEETDNEESEDEENDTVMGTA